MDRRKPYRYSRCMRIRSFLTLLLLLTAALLAAPALPADEPWEIAAVDGLRAMNRGDGETFVKVAHPEFKKKMRDMIVRQLMSTPGSRKNDEILKPYGVATVEELVALDPELMLAKLIYILHESVPPVKRQMAKDAKFKVISSDAEGDERKVYVDMEFTAEGKTIGGKTVLLAKRDGDVWKYNGDVMGERRQAK